MRDWLVIELTHVKPDQIPAKERERTNEQGVVMNCGEDISMEELMDGPQSAAAGAMKTGQAIKIANRIKRESGRIERE